MNQNTQRNVLVTGGTGSVGQALVKAFVANGDFVTFQYYSKLEVAAELQSTLGVEMFCLDFSSDFHLPRRDFSVVINNTGVNITNALSHEVTLDDWNYSINVNLTSVFRISQMCLPYMIDNQWGRIINISSIYGLRAVEGNLPYTVSKHGMAGMTKTIAKEYAAYGITCNEICPGPIDSELLKAIAVREGLVSGVSRADYFKTLSEDIPAQKLAEPSDVVALALFLASSTAGYLNGASIPLDGGKIA